MMGLFSDIFRKATDGNDLPTTPETLSVFTDKAKVTAPAGVAAAKTEPTAEATPASKPKQEAYAIMGVFYVLWTKDQKVSRIVGIDEYESEIQGMIKSLGSSLVTAEQWIDMQAVKGELSVQVFYLSKKAIEVYQATGGLPIDTPMVKDNALAQDVINDYSDQLRAAAEPEPEPAPAPAPTPADTLADLLARAQSGLLTEDESRMLGTLAQLAQSAATIPPIPLVEAPEEEADGDGET